MDVLRKVEEFVNRKTDKQKIIVIYGPTACGKTSMSIDIAKKLDTDIISTDSRQIFKYMDIATAKITPEEMDGVVHHMIDFIDPKQKYSAGEFKKEAEIIISDLQKNNKIPILCGGTGLYIDSLIYDFNIPKVPEDVELRKSLEKQAEEKGKDYIFDKLKQLDPDYDRNLHPNNLRYVIRAIEVKMITGKSKTSFKNEKKLVYDTLFLCPDYKDRENLYNRINYRAELMVKNGLLGEFEKLLEMGYKKEDFAMRTIGYEELFLYKNGELSLEEAILLIQKNSRNYAKRQLTWFGKYKDN